MKLLGGLLSFFPPSAARAFFCIPLLSSDDGARQLPKKSQKEHPERAAGTSQHGCVRTRTMQSPCKARALAWFLCVRNRAPACHAPLLHLPSACSRSPPTYQVGGPSRCAPHVFPGTWKIFQFCFFYWLALPKREREFTIFVLFWAETLQLCSIIVSAPKGRDFTILFYWL